MELARRMSDRHFGAGGDGLILICPCERADAEMRMFNVDGSGSEMCGNGIRCVAKYLYDHGLCRRNPLHIESVGQIYSLELEVRQDRVERVRVDMGEPTLTPAAIPAVLAEDKDRACDVPLTVAGRELTVTCVSMGNPHCVLFVDEASDELVRGLGPQLEIDRHFPNRVNVEFVEVISPTEVRQRTWERGTGETLACGTGACAVCVAGFMTDRTEREICVHLTGGDLEIQWNADNNRVYMTGPAAEVYSGEWPEQDNSRELSRRSD